MAETIKKWIYSTLKDDSALQTITGYTASVPMIYYRGEAPDNIKDSLTTSNCYLTYFLVTDTPMPDDGGEIQIPDLSYQIDIWGKVPSVLESAFRRVDALLNKIYAPTILGYYVTSIHRIMQRDLGPDVDRVHNKLLEYKFYDIYEESA
jgi:hypothetical protein